MLFDTLINIFKTICIGLIAISPILVYKILDDSSDNYKLSQGTEFSENYSYNSGGSGRKNEEDITSNSGYQGIPAFGSSNFFASGGIAPPPPPGEDVPIDDGLWVLLIIGVGYGYNKLRCNPG